ncbi:MAG: hypothetical protein CMO74_15220 [Verrucomicrobiales bacterium]|nr:hypothetical protein [Verrucomicrobiales bacterium]MBL69770.1 hypothetical protein [Verrucomicrobiales bacterium]|tara:strand:+ start:18519 stop:19226 length:708 start_codon:yes stop_codon:yes gene_type:complete
MINRPVPAVQPYANMQLYVLKNNEKLGPLELEEVRNLLATGSLNPADQAWHEGAENWAPLSDIPGAMKKSKGAKADVRKPRASEPAQPMSSVARDVKNLKANTSTTTAEIRAFLAEMQGKSPREMLGVIAQSSLVSSLALSTVIITLLLAGFTGLAFAIGDDPSPPSIKAKKQEPQPEPNPKAGAKAPPKMDTRTLEEKAAKAMGVDKAKKGQPKEVNPFGSKPGGDDILGEIDN